ncbi:polymorphic toxin-type HINT domain-containing protein [Streptomyces sp. NPDC005931]|uniref:polymorphic toxin-type HINT domain-containing protein n=1 Tax=Streptomyces sp. NPDC005931 TaxID=3364737 RepID=UPI0036880333
MQSLALALVVPLGWAQVAQAAPKPGGLGRPEVPEPRVSKVKTFNGPAAKQARAKVAKDRAANAAQAKRATTEQKAVWPKQAEARLVLNRGKTAKASLGDIPLTLAPARASAKQAAKGETRITVLGQKAARKAGITGVLLTAEAHEAGTAEVSVDYSAFASAVGGDWSQRLRLVQLPSCVLTTPQKKECSTQKPLKSHNDIKDQSVSAAVLLNAAEPAGATTQTVRSEADAASGMTVLAVTAASAGSGQSPTGAGDYSATPLSASSAWEAGGSSGAFTWSYGFTVPPAAAGPTPPLSLSYDSGSIDGRTATTNNQGSAVGEGFSFTESYIERSYGSCDDDGYADVFDLCWKYDNARLVLNGKSNRLVKDNTSGQWRLEDDDASKVTRSTGADNGDDNGEYWTVTTGDGTKYVFGLNKLDGAATQRTNSTWTVPVFGDDSGEPGYAGGGTFADRALTQAWRWNLDYIEDTRGNASTYWYTKETNHYKKNKATTANASYTRGGYLAAIEYGLRKGELFTDKADAKVTFDHLERCTAADCSSLTQATAENWPDVPFDAICSDGDTECYAAGPSFFSRKRLTGIDTFSYNATTNAYDPVDSWALVQQYLDGGDIGDSSDQVLTLKSLKRTGKAGATSIALNPISFTYQMRPNRVDATDDILPLTRPRISTITSETGAITTVTLSSTECVRSEVTGAAEDTNTRSCYPQYWHINGAENAAVDWFHKYRVLGVTVSDPASGNEAVEHSYSYSGAAWHHSDDPFTPKTERTWSDWRGYQKVTAYTGAISTTRLKTLSLYLQGMDGDKKADGTTKSVSVEPLLDTDVDFTAVADSDQYKGRLRQQVTYNGGQPISSSFINYTYRRTGTQTVPDATAHVSQWVRDTVTYTSTHLTATNGWRTHVATKRYDTLGMVTSVDDYGQKGLGGDETCTRTWYARNDAAGITGLVSRSRTVARECSITDTSLDLPATSGSRGEVLSDTAVVYDNPTATTWSATQQPSKGQATWTGRATGYTATADASGERVPAGWQTVTTSTYDTLGRPRSITDAANNTTSTAYTPEAAGPLTKTITTNPKLYNAVSFLDPRRGLTLRSYDINQKKTELNYDALGRLTEVWLPNRIRGSQAPNTKFAYHLDNTKPSWVSASTLKKDGDTYNTSYSLYDALLRPLQTQAPTPQGGRLLTDTRYDNRGLANETYADIFDTTSTPNGTYTRAEYGAAPTQTQTVFDAAGRPTTSTLLIYGVKKWSTTTTYTGDSVATTALEGGSAQRTITDIRGRTTETREYAGTNPADTTFGTGPGATYAATKFTYALDGQQTSITGPDTAKWTYAYDLFGRQTSTNDPDKGTTSTEYNTLDQVIKTTDARGKSILTDYDVLGRPTGTWSGSKTDANQLTGYTYDAPLKGLPTSSTRYAGGRTGQAYTTTVTAYDSLNRATGTELTLPGSDPIVTAGAPATLAYESYYNIDGTLQYSKEPAMGGLPSENIGYTYDGLGNLTSIGGSTGYLRDVTYSALAQPQQLTLGTGGTDSKNIYVTKRFEEGTGRLTRSHVTDQSHPYMLQDLNYGYDQAGNVTSIKDPTTLGGTSSADTQCFAYDGHRRMIEAWTPTSQDCTTTRTATGTGGPAPYWTSYTYNSAGQRTTETQHGVGIRAGQDTQRAYTYPASGQPQPHSLTKVDTTGDGTRTQSFTYDATGNTTKRATSVQHQYLRAGWKLTAGQEVRSQKARLVMREDGDLVIYNRDTGAVRWHTNTAGNPGAWATMQDDGNFVVYSADNAKLWSTNTTKGAGSGYFATLQDGGSFAVYSADWTLQWTAGSWIGTAPISSGTHTHTWDDEGRIATTTAPNGIKTTYLYDAGGQLLIRATENGERILYAGATELHLRADNTTWAQRYYTADSVTAAVRSNESGTNTLTYLAGDHHGTSSLAVTPNGTQAFTKRYTTPFGADRGEAAGDTTTWPDDKGFLGKTRDEGTGLTHIGAREYDPTLGQFLSVDPVLETDKPHTLNGYSYANQNPATFSDPTGLCLDPGNGRCHQSTTSGSGKGGDTRDKSFPLNPGVTHSEKDKGTATQQLGRIVQSEMPGTPTVDFIDAFAIQLAEAESRWWKIYSEPLPLDQIGAVGAAACHRGFGDRICSQEQMSYFLYELYWTPEKVVELALGSGRGGYQAFATGKGAKARTTGTACNCFLAGTDVLMADGSTKDIEDVDLGDKVMATDPETGEEGPREVTRLIRTEDDKHFNRLTIATSDGVEELTATHEHPFWSPSQKSWMEASDLTAGMTLLTDDGDTVIVTANKPFTKHARTYNLTVADLHTYYVLAGATPVLVHNSNCAPGTLPGTRFDVPEQPGIYTIHLNDGTKYVGSSTSSIRERVNKSMRSKHAVRKAGYTADDVVNVTYFTLPSGTSKTAIRRMEQTMMEGVKARGGTLLNRRDPEIEVPFGGYLP